MALEQTWRWFGPKDPITLREIRQTGATGIVTALHHIPTGKIWAVDEIMERKQLIESEGLRWSVTESIPVHENIKKRTFQYQQFIENYKTSIRNLGRCGVDIICYNFMPVLDWTRTDLNVTFRDGSITSQFQSKALAAFDLFILDRPKADENYTEAQVREAREYYAQLDEIQKTKLHETILLGFPGSGDSSSYSPEGLRSALRDYNEIGEVELRENLHHFIKEIVPAAEEAGVLLGIHPDDPPFPLFGLPRIVSTKKDLESILSVTESRANGLTFCTGSLGAGSENNVTDIARTLAHRFNFIHLRNVSRNDRGDFVEENHLEGDVDMCEVMKVLVLEQKRRKDEGRTDHRMPMRPDHGHLMLADQLLAEQRKRQVYPGYSLVGRMRGLAELRGLELGIRRSLGLAS